MEQSQEQKILKEAGFTVDIDCCLRCDYFYAANSYNRQGICGKLSPVDYRIVGFAGGYPDDAIMVPYYGKCKCFDRKEIKR